MWEKERYLILAAVITMMLLSACNVPGEQADQLLEQLEPTVEGALDLEVPDTDDPVFASVETSELVLKGPQCQPDGFQLTAQLQPDPSSITGVMMRYRLQGSLPDQQSDWAETELIDEGVVNDQIVFRAQLPELGSQALELFEDGTGVLEYQLEATDGAGNSSSWPTDEPVAELTVAPCELASDLAILDGSLEPQFAEYGQAPGCQPSIVTFGLTLENADALDEAWVDTRWYVGDFDSGDYQAASEPIKLPLLPVGSSDEYPGSTVFGVNLEVQEGGQTHLQGEDGFLGWRMRVRDDQGAIGEWPLGDAPPVYITACSGDFAPNPTATLGGIVIVPTASPTPSLQIAPQPTATLGLQLIPGELLEASGRDVVIEHEQAFDFDTGMVVNPGSATADFILAEGDDPYLDDMAPANGAYVGWGGFEVDSKSDCNILQSVSPMPVGWPDQANSYYCFTTSEGRIAWLQLDTYVSQPFSERRMIFHFKTFK